MIAVAGLRVRTGAYLLFLAFLACVRTAAAQELDCVECHRDQALANSVHAEIGCADCHSAVGAEHPDALPADNQEADSCGMCHRAVLRALARSVHDEVASCLDCHGDPHHINPGSDISSPTSPVNQIDRCGACHDSAEGLPDGYKNSVHGEALLVAGLINAPSCNDCHGSHHILQASDARATTSRQEGPRTCGTCHALLFEDWVKLSAHGIAWQGGLTGPTCTDCHSSHDIADPKVGNARLSAPENCGGCHAAYLTSFRDSFHGKANDLGFLSGATCSDCHTPHKNSSAANTASSVHPDNLTVTCGRCHDDITASFVTFDPHNDPKNPHDSMEVYIVWLFMTGLLIGVFAFFGVHDVLWLQRSLVGMLRGEYAAETLSAEDRYVRRFSKITVWMHVVIIVTFLLLAATGLPLKFHWASWAQTLTDMLGGIDTTRFLHRLAAAGTLGYAAFHLGHLFVRRLLHGESGLFWGNDSLVPQPRDFRDFIANIRYFVYCGSKPAGDRWTYFEKFDYFAVFWGIVIIGTSGLMLWFPSFFASFLPGWTLNAAYIVHSEEALLATGFIFVFHFFHTHLRPDSFPMDLSIFTGKVPLERLKSERPLEYRRLVDSGELSDYLVAAPTAAEMRKAYLFGSIALIVGISLAVGIIWALLWH